MARVLTPSETQASTSGIGSFLGKLLPGSETTPSATAEASEAPHIDLFIAGVGLHGRKDNKIRLKQSEEHGCDVEALKKAIIAEFALPECIEMKIFFDGFEVVDVSTEEEKDSGTLLSFYGIDHQATVVVVLKEGVATAKPETAPKRAPIEKPKTISEIARETDQRFPQLKAMLEKRLHKPASAAPLEPPKFEDVQKMMKDWSVQVGKAVDPITLLPSETAYMFPCGHGMEGDSLYAFCVSKLKQGHSFISCPTQVPADKDSDDSKTKSCDEIMPLPMIRECLKHECGRDCESIGSPSAKEKIEAALSSKLGEIQLMVNSSKIQDELEVQVCKKCSTILYRNKADNCSRLKSVCPLCTHDANQDDKEPGFYDRIVATLSSVVGSAKTKEGEKPKTEEKKEDAAVPVEEAEEEKDDMTKHYFCWACASDWGEKCCTNVDCVSSTRAEVIETLKLCEKKKIGSVENVPSIRACPECGQMINHIDCCKHIHCKRCNTQYCFVCLKRHINGRGWQCGSSGDVCPVHPVQTDENLPTGSRSTFNLYDTLKQ